MTFDFGLNFFKSFLSILMFCSKFNEKKLYLKLHKRLYTSKESIDDIVHHMNNILSFLTFNNIIRKRIFHTNYLISNKIQISESKTRNIIYLTAVA